MRRDFQRLAIVNRGEPAMRLIHAVRELNRERDAGVTTIALYTDPDRRARFVREADEALSLGEATYLDEGRRKVSYLDYARLERALREARAEAVWVGWGFVSEHAAFAELCRSMGIVFVGPEPEVMRKLGDKISSKLLAEDAGVPVAPWSGGPVSSVEEAIRHADRLGFPVMIKATAGGGGRGIREVRSMSDLPAAFEGARAEARGAFGDPTVFIERRVPAARHIEVQIIGDHHGRIWACGVRDCTIQRRHQKVLEEAPSPALTPEEDRWIREASVRLAQRAGYTNAGTVEFLFEPAERRFSFMEVNARLQVEHPVTEMTTGLDMVKLQLHVARGGELAGEPPEARGHAIEVRINAEDPERDFAPAPGVVDLLRLPTGPGLRIDAGVSEGDSIPAEFDSMIAKLIAWGRDRDEALARLSRALRETSLVVRGGASNKAFLLDLCARPETAKAEMDNVWLDGLAARGEHVTRAHADVALLSVAIDGYHAEVEVERTRFFATAARGRPRLERTAQHDVELRHRGASYRFGVQRVGRHDYRVDAGGGVVLDVRVERLGRLERRLTTGGRGYRVLSVAEGVEHLVEIDGIPHRVSRDAGGVVRAPTPAVVLHLPVKAGDQVSAGERVAVLEAMKMEMVVVAPFAGRVREVLVVPNVQVDAGAPLLELDLLDQVEGPEADRVRFSITAPPPEAAADPRARWARAYLDLRRLLLGYDVDAAAARRVATAWQDASRGLPEADPELLRAEEDVLGTFADLQALFRRMPVADDPDGPEEGSTQEHFLSYLRALDSRGEGLPATFLEKLQRTLAHYGVHTLDPSPELEDALVRIWRGRDRGEEQAAAVAATLERRLSQCGKLGAAAGDTFHQILDRLVTVARRRFPLVYDLALEVRHICFDEPMFERARAAVTAQAAACLAELERLGDEGGPPREARIESLVDCPQPLLGLLAPRFEAASPALRAAMLEVLTRRYYRIRALDRLEARTADGLLYIATEYPHEDRRVRAFTTYASLGGLADAARRLAPVIAEAGDPRDVVVDFYLWSPAPLDDPDAQGRSIRAALDEGGLPRGLRRVVVAVAGSGRSGPAGVVERAQSFTYRASNGDYVEEAAYRGLHPMIGKRMHMWRMRKFQLERLPSAEDVYLFRGVALENPKDERLFALAEVRDLTPLRDERGRIFQLPYLERMLAECVAAIRTVQARRPARERLQWNRVLLYLWPPLMLTPGELRDVVHRLAPATEGLGIEQVVVRARVPDASGGLRDTVIRVVNTLDQGLHLTLEDPSEEPLETLTEYEQKVIQLRRRGLMYPYELVKLHAPPRDGGSEESPRGEFIEHDLDEAGALRPVDRPPGQNRANIVVGLVRSFTRKHPEGMTRVILLGDASREMGSLSEPECRRIIAALDLAAELRAPLEWFALSAGAKISMQSGTENMDWISHVLRRIIEFTQAGGEINVVVCGINVGAQPYWNAEATMLMHTRGVLIMIDDTAMVLTGKQALDYSGSVSAEDNQGIGGYERIMGVNGQAQYRAEDIGEACAILTRHYDHTYVAPGERFPRRAHTDDPADRDVRDAPHPGPEFATVGEVFSDAKNPERKRPFDIRAVMRAVSDQDHRPLERWRDMRDAEIAVIWDAHLGGYPVCMLGLESHPLPRYGGIPGDGPEQWTAGTLFPRSSKKVARAVNAASGNRPLVVLANLSGFDGSPESMRNLQLEYGAEIGRAVVNFDGPIVFCVVSRYHGGAFVVFSKRLSDEMEVVALEGAHASVIGGAPAAAVVFAREVDQRTSKDVRVTALEEALARAPAPQKAALRARLSEVRPLVRSEKLGEVADEFDRIHSVRRALEVGSLDRIIPVARMRPYLIEALERGIHRTLARHRSAGASSP